MQYTRTQLQSGLPASVEVFEYPGDPTTPALPDWGGSASGEAAAEAPAEEPVDPCAAAEALNLHAEFDRRIAEETRRSFEAGREVGRQEGRAAEREDLAAAQTAAEERRVRQAAALIEDFAQERDRYLQAVEHEVVELALAIAARILRRESQMDPLLLTGAVRVAIGQLIGTTKVRLLVPAPEVDLWTEAMAAIPNLPVRPAVVAGEEMRLGDCSIQTELGTVDLGIRAQMGEIERGFFDRAATRSASPAAAGSTAELGK